MLGALLHIHIFTDIYDTLPCSRQLINENNFGGTLKERCVII